MKSVLLTLWSLKRLFVHDSKSFKVYYPPKSSPYNSDVVSNLKKEICLLEDEKSILEFLLEDCDIELTKLYALIDATTTKIVFLEFNFLEKYKMVRLSIINNTRSREKLKNHVKFVICGLIEILSLISYWILMILMLHPPLLLLVINLIFPLRFLMIRLSICSIYRVCVSHAFWTSLAISLLLSYTNIFQAMIWLCWAILRNFLII